MSLYGNEVPTWLLEPEGDFFSDTDKQILDALFDRILPGDQSRQIPAASEAGVSTFVSKLLQRDESVYFEIPNWQKLYSSALPALTQYAHGKFGKQISELDSNDLNTLISGLESGKLSPFPAEINQNLFFVTLRRHCIQGCFSDPRWGGNKDKIMWRAIGYLQQPEDLYS